MEGEGREKGESGREVGLSHTGENEAQGEKEKKLRFLICRTPFLSASPHLSLIVIVFP